MTAERWSTKTSDLSVVINERGLPEPMVCVVGKCQDCGVLTSDLDPVVLRRLRDVPELLSALPFDPEFPFSSLYLHRVHTTALSYDTITRQTAQNVLDRIEMLGAEAVQERGEPYMAHGQIWLRQLAALVGDETWGEYYTASPTHLILFALGSLRGGLMAC